MIDYDSFGDSPRKDNKSGTKKPECDWSPAMVVLFGLGFLLSCAFGYGLSSIWSDLEHEIFDYRMQVSCERGDVAESSEGAVNCGSLVETLTDFAEESGVDVDRMQVLEMSNTGVKVLVLMDASAADLTALETRLVGSGFEFLIKSS
jgi:hypothetical protein